MRRYKMKNKQEDQLDMSSILLNAGFERELILWSFRPEFYDKDDGYYYSKFVPIGIPNSPTNSIEIGVIINSKYKSMEVYMCDCMVGCCGKDLGIHPFSLEKIDELLKGERIWLDELQNKYPIKV